MTRHPLWAAGLLIAMAGVLPAQPPAPIPPTIPKQDPNSPVKSASMEIYGSLDNIDLSGGVPGVRVIASQKGWEAQARLWGIPNPPRVDFTRELLVVGTSASSKLVLETKLDTDGDLRVNPLGNGDNRAGFRYGIKSVNRAGVKTVNGQRIPVE